MTADLYIQSVIDLIPHRLPLRDQIALELRSHIAERVAQGQPLDDILHQLGDPLTLAESYLAAVPLHSARTFPRLIAKLIDVAIIVAIFASLSAVLWRSLPPDWVYWVPMFCIVGSLFSFVIYTFTTEYRYGRTLGKHLMGIQVVRESGARISLGQSFLRQLPFFGQFFFFDALFALFTERKQRAFELLTKTRAVAMLVMVLLTPA